MTLSEQKEYIKDMAFTMPLKRIAKTIGRSSTFVSSEMKRQGINVPLSIRNGFRKQSQFNNGHVAFNKGVPQNEWMSIDKIEKSKRSRFKKGNLPHNTKNDLDVSIRRDTNLYSYMYIRISLGKWILYHRYLWEQMYGVIPLGFNIQFKDGNSLNCNLDNLYMIDRKEQSVINKQGGRNIPHELQKTILLVTKLKKQIYEKQDN